MSILIEIGIVGRIEPGWIHVDVDDVLVSLGLR